MHLENLQFLRLLQIADSALPIGTTAHSFGIETLTTEEELEVTHLEAFLREYLLETGLLECVFCRLSYQIIQQETSTTYANPWLELNARLSALKTARESRVASATLGRRLLQLFAALEPDPRLQEIQQASKHRQIDLHYSTVFGLLGALLMVDEDATILAYTQQSLAGMVSACQRLLPLGQNLASQIQWQLKQTLVEITHKSKAVSQDPEAIAVFTPLLDVGSMRHPTLITRLFIS